MENRILFFSGGLSSFSVAHHLKVNYPNDNIVLYFTDTLWEDEDLYRFIDEVSDKLKLPMLVHSMLTDPVELMIKQKILYNSRIGNCSTILKMKVASDFIKKDKKPRHEHWVNKEYLKDDNFKEDAVLYFGISFDEIHRTKAIKHNWLPFESEFPLTKMFYDYDELLKLYDIQKPRLYLKGFTHNNCKGRCVKAGKRHYRLLYNEDYETFIQLEEIERLLSDYVDTYHQLKKDDSKKELLLNNQKEMMLWHDTQYTHKPKLYIEKTKNRYSFMKTTSLTEIKKEMESGMKLNLFDEDIGGCGCFVDYE